VRSGKRVYIFAYAFTFTFISSIQQPDDGPDRDQNLYLHHHKHAVVLNWKYKSLFINNWSDAYIFMFINSDTKYPYCELPEMPQLHTITEILDKGVWLVTLFVERKLNYWLSQLFRPLNLGIQITSSYFNLHIYWVMCCKWYALMGCHTHKHTYCTRTVLHQRSSTVWGLFSSSLVCIHHVSFLLVHYTIIYNY